MRQIKPLRGPERPARKDGIKISGRSLADHLWDLAFARSFLLKERRGNQWSVTVVKNALAKS